MKTMNLIRNVLLVFYFMTVILSITIAIPFLDTESVIDVERMKNLATFYCALIIGMPMILALIAGSSRVISYQRFDLTSVTKKKNKTIAVVVSVSAIVTSLFTMLKMELNDMMPHSLPAWQYIAAASVVAGMYHLVIYVLFYTGRVLSA